MPRRTPALPSLALPPLALSTRAPFWLGLCWLGLCPSLAALPTLPAAAATACDVKGAKIEEAIAAKAALRRDANAQTLRDLRTLRDAAIVLDAYAYPGECEVLLGIARALLADPDKTIEAGDTDEEKAEGVAEARTPKAPGQTAPN